MQRFDGSFQQLLGSGGAEYCAASPRAEVVNEMEWSSRRVQDRREAPASPLWQAVKEADYRQEAAHDEITEHHVEQQLLIRPPRTIR
jgi:hypothetical protein